MKRAKRRGYTKAEKIALRQIRLLCAIWTDQVFKDVGRKMITYSCFTVAYSLKNFTTMDDSLGKFMRQGKLIIWPKISDVKDRTTMAESSISFALHVLVKLGHLKKLRRGNQHAGSNKFILILRNPPSQKVLDDLAKSVPVHI